MALKCLAFRRQLIVFCTLSFVGGALPQRDNSDKHHNYNSFETPNNTKVTAQIGGTAILPCTVEASSLATVTWIRRSDYSLLTVGLTIYSRDERFHIEHLRHKGIWDLRIKAVRKADEGVYECNLSLHPPESIFIEINVVEAVAEIVGSPEIHIDEGSRLKLECKIVHATENPTYVFWYHEDKMVNFNAQEGYTVVMTHKTSLPLLQKYQKNDDLDSYNLIQHSFELPTASSSVLFVHEVQFKHGGNYTCAPSNTRPTFLQVHVLKGDKPAAMKHSNQSETAEVKSSAAINKSLYSIFNILLFGMYRLNFFQT